MLTQNQKISVRHHLGIPFSGTATAGRIYGFRFSWFNEDVEFKLNNMQPSEEQLLTGATLGSWRIQGQPTVGDVITYNLNTGTQVLTVNYTVQTTDLARQPNPVNPSESSPLYAIALNSAQVLNTAIQPLGYSAVGVMPADLYSPQYMPPYFAEVIITGPGAGTSFVLSASTVGSTNVFTENPGTECPVRASIIDAATNSPVVAYGYLQICDLLSNSMTQASLSLTYQTADVVTFRPDEVKARKRLYQEYCNKLKRVLGGQEYVRKFGGTGASGTTA